MPDVLARPGVERATWWENVYVDRDDLHRVLPEFTPWVSTRSTTVRAAATPDGIDGLHFRRYAPSRPGHPVREPDHRAVARADHPEGTEHAQALRDWGDFVHIRHIAEVGVPGYTMITPYENATGGDPRYLHFYEMDTDEPELRSSR